MKKLRTGPDFFPFEWLEEGLYEQYAMLFIKNLESEPSNIKSLHRIMSHPQNGLGWKGHYRPLSPTPCHGLGAPHQLRLPETHPTWHWAPPGMGYPLLSGHSMSGICLYPLQQLSILLVLGTPGPVSKLCLTLTRMRRLWYKSWVTPKLAPLGQW